MKKPIQVFAVFCLLILFGHPAAAEIHCDYITPNCTWKAATRSTTSAPAYPSTSTSIKINPSAVPVDKSLGLEAILYKTDWDFALIKGLGRVGAAISPSNNEDTFFGPPNFELPETYQARKNNQDKYKSQKITLATAFNVYSNHQSDLERFELNLGAMGKYNTTTGSAWPGAGINGIAGPFTFGYAVYKDETLLDYKPYSLDQKPKIRYLVETYSVGIFLKSLAIDYSILRLITTNVSTISVITASLLLQRAMFTVATRSEDSGRPFFNSDGGTLQSQQVKQEYFGGAQFAVHRALMVGGFYNYYLLHELSAGITLFF